MNHIFVLWTRRGSRDRLAPDGYYAHHSAVTAERKLRHIQQQYWLCQTG